PVKRRGLPARSSPDPAKYSFPEGLGDMRRILPLLLLGLVMARPSNAQSSLVAVCDRDEVQQLGAVEECIATVQAAVSGQPTLGILIAGGNPTVGSSGAAGFR